MPAQRKIRLRKKRDKTQRMMRDGTALCGFCRHWGQGVAVIQSMYELGMCWHEKSYDFKISVPGNKVACSRFEPID